MSETGPPTWADVREYAGVDDDVLTLTAYDAEVAAQRSVCLVPADDVVWPEDLREALRRRVAHNIAMRSLPIAVQGTADGSGVTRVGGSDPEVRRLEQPFRKRKLA